MPSSRNADGSMYWGTTISVRKPAIFMKRNSRHKLFVSRLLAAKAARTMMFNGFITRAAGYKTDAG